MNIENITRSERVIAIHFEKLFGRFNYDVVLNKEGLTILTGPNGYGKSTILKSIEAIGNELLGIVYFFSLDFRKITVCFQNENRVVIEKKEDSVIINDIRIDGELFRNGLEGIMERRPYFVRVDEDTWMDRRRGVRYSMNEYLAEIYFKEQNQRMIMDNSDVLPEEILSLLKNMKPLFATMCNQYKKRGIKYTEVQASARCIFRWSDLLKTEMYSKIKECSQVRNLSILCAAA